jgi:hypothetical protein
MITFTKERRELARDRSGMAAMVDVDSFLLALDDIEYLENRVSAFEEASIVLDTNGEQCVICGGQDDDFEGVIHAADCPFNG